MDRFKKLLRGVTAAMLAVGLLAGGVTGTANAADNNTYDLWFGDSQMYGQGIEGDAVRSEKRFSKLVSDADNATEVNVAVSGAHWTGGNNRFGVQIDKLINRYSGTNVRRIIGQGVYNDCSNITANSTDAQVRNVAQQITDTAKPYYAKLRRAFPDAQIAYIPQVAVWGTVQKNNAKFANIVKVGRYVSEGLKNQGWTVMDMDDDLGMLVGRQEYLADSIHINVEGHAMAAQGIISWLDTTSPTVSESTPTLVTYRPKAIDIVSGEDVSDLLYGATAAYVQAPSNGTLNVQKIERAWPNVTGDAHLKYDYVGVDPNSSYLKHNPTEFVNPDNVAETTGNYWTINTDDSMLGKVLEQKLLVKAKHIVNVTYVDADTNQPVKAYTNVIGPLKDHVTWSVVLTNWTKEYPYPSEYTFVGLSNQSDGTVYQQTDGGVSVRGTADKEINNVIALLSHVITYNANGGTGSMNATKTCEPVATSTFTRSGYQFTGWNTRADGTGQNVKAGDTASFTANTTLYAQWQATSHTVTFDTNGGNAITPQTVDDKGKAKEPTAPTRDSWTFAGWYLNGVKYDFATPVTQDITLKAGWKRVAPSMEFKDMHKRISAGSKSGQRKLTLDVKGTGETNKSVTPSDVVILVDETNSMRECADGSSKADSGIQCSTGPSKRDNLGNIIDSAVTSILATNAGRSADQQSRISVIRFAGRNSKYPPKALSQFTTDKNVALPNGWNQGDDLSQTGTDWATSLEHVGEAGTTRSNVNKQIILVTDGLASAANEDYIKAGTNANALHQINNPEILKKVVKAYGYANQRTMRVTQSLAKAGWHLRVVGVSADASATALGDSYLAGAYPYVGKDGSIGLYKKGSQPSGYSSQIEWIASVANNAGDSTAIGSDFEATDINDITSTLTSTVITSTTMRNTVISDPLSEWVDPVGLVDGKGTGITVSKDGKPMDSGYTAVYDGSSRTVKVSLPDSLDDGSVYSVSFEVALSDKARLNYMQSGTYPDTGDADTGTTSAGKKGYSTNGNATLSWDAVTSTNGTPLIVSHKAKYAKPVTSYDSSNVPPVLTNKLPGTGGVASLMPVFIGAGLALALAAVWIVRKRLSRLP